MKKLIAIFAIFATTTTFACGNFAGNFQCTFLTDGSTYNMIVEQNGTTFTMINDEESTTIYADGNTHQIADSDFMRNANYTAQCVGNAINTNMSGDIIDESSGMSFPFTGTSVYELKTRNHVNQISTINMLGQSQTTEVNCTRL